MMGKVLYDNVQSDPGMVKALLLHIKENRP